MKLMLITFACWLITFFSATANPFTNTSLPTPVKISSVQVADVDPLKIITPEQVLSIAVPVWQATEQGKIPLKQGGNWYKVEIVNSSNQAGLAFLTLGNEFLLKDVELYRVLPSNELTYLPLELLANNQWVSQVILPPNQYQVLYLKVVSDAELQIPFLISSASSFISDINYQLQQNGFIIGGITFVAMLLLFLSITTRDAALGCLSAYFFMRALLLSVFVGGHLFYLFPNHDELRGLEVPVLVALSTIAFLWFTANLFQFKKQLPKALLPFKFITGLLLGYALLSFYLPVASNMMLSGTITILMTVVLAALGLYMHKKKQRLALLYTILLVIQLIFTLGILISVYLGSPLFESRESLQIESFLVNTFLILFLICYLYYYQVQDKQNAQKLALENALASKKANEQLIQVQEENQEDLEQRVQERTLELNIALTELEELNRELEQKNTIDELTGLYNRRFYDQRILAEYRRSKRNLTPLSLVIIDLDFFKKVNDKYGHLAGDQCLVWLTQHIKQGLKRSSDVGCRYGGEEFCLILPDTDQGGALALAEELRQLIENFDFIYKDQHISLTISCGIATYTQQENIEPEHLFLAADKALYQAKNNGRNRVCTQEISPDLLIQELLHV